MEEEELIMISSKTQKEEKPHMVRCRVKPETLRSLRIHCAEEGLSVQVVLEALLIKYLEDQKK